MVGSVNERASAFLVPPDRPAEEALIAFGVVLGQNNDFVCSNITTRRYGPGLNRNQGFFVRQAGRETGFLPV